ncbi:MAG: argininosuccinate lyase [Anaerolineae bacterium]|nr:argininosuccinate lyase [Anaerolineae bacterium]MBL8105980.1 argininosuccinate lyase [Anaerolineales bacterium]MCC7189075.1 argininosuccinate lyase [Anaerolineales bacterium]
MTLWGGRFSTKLNQQAWDLNSSLAVDQRLALHDIDGSLAWAQAIHQAGILADKEHASIALGLDTVRKEFSQGQFTFAASDEDIHTAVERRLTELIGDAAGKLHTGRSRNDQVATDFRLWMLSAIPELQAALKDLQTVLVENAEAALPHPQPFSQREKGVPSPTGEGKGEGEGAILMPGYTHLQRAQPILLAHWWLSHVHPLQRDMERLNDLTKRVSVLPLGSGALAGVPFEVDRSALAKTLGFAEVSQNSMDAVSDRDFAAEYLFCATMIGVHQSKLAEQIVLFTSAEFGFFELADAFSTGSSLMPQKKNPDVFELTRGKAGTLLGLLTGLLATLKGLPSTYDKDLQEDKAPVFQATDTLLVMLPVIAEALRTITVKPERMRDAIDSSMLATDLADYLVNKGVPFRKAHEAAGRVVRVAGEGNVRMEKMPLEAYQAIRPEFEADVYQAFDLLKSIEKRNAIGGTSLKSVKMQIAECKMQNAE